MTYSHNTAPTHYVQVGDVSYAYRSFGVEKGIPILMLGHFRAGLDNWDPMVTDGLARHFPVILFNNAGVASSSGEPATSVAGMARHVARFIGELGLEKVYLLGFSLGGFVAQQVAADTPHLVERLILAGTGPRGGEDMAEYDPKVGVAATNKIPVESDFLYLFFEPSGESQAAGRAFWSRRHERQEQDPPSSMEAMQAQAEAIAAWGKVPEGDRYSQLAKIVQPTFIANGDHDIMVPTINSFIMKRRIADSVMAIYPDAGHGAIFQYADLFVSQVKDFLSVR